MERMKAQAEELAAQIYALAFGGPREPRSPEYRRGVLCALRFRAGAVDRIRLPADMEEGTAAADAWFAGVQEGLALWQACEERLR